jgi:hypothetical protein
MYYRKEKCSKEDKSKKKEATVPGNKADNQVILQKMEYLQNQNNPSEFGRYFFQIAQCFLRILIERQHFRFIDTYLTGPRVAQSV